MGGRKTRARRTGAARRSPANASGNADSAAAASAISDSAAPAPTSSTTTAATSASSAATLKPTRTSSRIRRRGEVKKQKLEEQAKREKKKDEKEDEAECSVEGDSASADESSRAADDATGTASSSVADEGEGDDNPLAQLAGLASRRPSLLEVKQVSAYAPVSKNVSSGESDRKQVTKDQQSGTDGEPFDTKPRPSEPTVLEKVVTAADVASAKTTSESMRSKGKNGATGAKVGSENVSDNASVEEVERRREDSAASPDLSSKAKQTDTHALTSNLTDVPKLSTLLVGSDGANIYAKGAITDDGVKSSKKDTRQSMPTRKPADIEAGREASRNTGSSGARVPKTSGSRDNDVNEKFSGLGHTYWQNNQMGNPGSSAQDVRDMESSIGKIGSSRLWGNERKPKRDSQDDRPENSTNQKHMGSNLLTASRQRRPHTAAGQNPGTGVIGDKDASDVEHVQTRPQHEQDLTAASTRAGSVEQRKREEVYAAREGTEEKAGPGWKDASKSRIATSNDFLAGDPSLVGKGSEQFENNHPESGTASAAIGDKDSTTVAEEAAVGKQEKFIGTESQHVEARKNHSKKPGGDYQTFTNAAKNNSKILNHTVASLEATDGCSKDQSSSNPVVASISEVNSFKSDNGAQRKGRDEMKSRAAKRKLAEALGPGLLNPTLPDSGHGRGIAKVSSKAGYFGTINADEGNSTLDKPLNSATEPVSGKGKKRIRPGTSFQLTEDRSSTLSDALDDPEIKISDIGQTSTMVPQATNCLVRKRRREIENSDFVSATRHVDEFEINEGRRLSRRLPRSSPESSANLALSPDDRITLTPSSIARRASTKDDARRRGQGPGRIKLMLFSTGSRVHRCRGYEKLFSDYWDAVSMLLSGDVSESDSVKCRSVLKSFLKTRKLRKLHNLLVMGLLERCINPRTLLHEVSHQIPETWRKRIKLVSEGKEDAEKESVVADNSIIPSAAEASTQITSQYGYGPMFSESDLAAEKAESECYETVSTALRIPGALSIDPYVRSLAGQSGLKVSEHAVWLLVVAMKEYASSIVKSSISYTEALRNGHVPSEPLLRPQVLNKKSDSHENVNPSPPQPTSKPTGSKCITARDLHAFVSSTPMGATQSLGACVSRLAFERSLFASSGVNLVPGQQAFDDLKRFINAELSPVSTDPPNVENPAKVLPTTGGTIPSRQPLLSEKEKPASTPEGKQAAPNTVKGRRSPYGGLGRGAKDLAALKARASFVKGPTGDIAASEPSKETANNEGARPRRGKDLPVPGGAGRGNPVTAGRATPDDQSANATTQTNATAPSPSPGPANEPKPQSPPARRGKGFGVKNLAAMRARSLNSESPSKKDGSGESTTGAPAHTSQPS